VDASGSLYCMSRCCVVHLNQVRSLLLHLFNPGYVRVHRRRRTPRTTQTCKQIEGLLWLHATEPNNFPDSVPKHREQSTCECGRLREFVFYLLVYCVPPLDWKSSYGCIANVFPELLLQVPDTTDVS